MYFSMVIELRIQNSVFPLNYLFSSHSNPSITGNQNVRGPHGASSSTIVLFILTREHTCMDLSRLNPDLLTFSLT